VLGGFLLGPGSHDGRRLRSLAARRGLDRHPGRNTDCGVLPGTLRTRLRNTTGGRKWQRQ
jgi:hypothetical protein